MEAQAITKYLHIGQRKVLGLCKLVRGKNIIVAKTLLLRSPKKGSQLILKTLNSAQANARNKNMDEKRLIIDTIKADIGPSAKRHLVWSRGVSKPIHKRTTHLTIVLREAEDLKNKKVSNTQEKSEEQKKEGTEIAQPTVTQQSEEKKTEAPESKKTAKTVKRKSPKKEKAKDTEKKQ